MGILLSPLGESCPVSEQSEWFRAERGLVDMYDKLISMKVTTTHIDGMSFEATSESKLKVTMDAAEMYGGENKGMSPKELLLAGLTGCTGMDVVSILKKMRVAYSSFQVSAEATQSDVEPTVFTAIELDYIFKGTADKEKIERAIKLSLGKYCGVSAMLKKTAKISYQLTLQPLGTNL